MSLVVPGWWIGVRQQRGTVVESGERKSEWQWESRVRGSERQWESRMRGRECRVRGRECMLCVSCCLRLV